MKNMEQNYLEQLSVVYPTIEKASAEIINLQSILNLPKGTEHFLSDIHGEYEAFSHVLRNGSGAVSKKIDDVFGHTLSTTDKLALATLIYYPEEKMELIREKQEDIDDWYKITLYRLIEVCKIVSSKYTRSKVRKALPKDYAYIIEELIAEKPEVLNKEAYYESIINTIIELGNADRFIISISELIQRLVVDHLHVIGDIYDRGPGPHLIMDKLCSYHSLDIEWGNHDVLWMGAAVGQMACIANVIRNSIQYGNLEVLEDGYGINMLPLAVFALQNYEEDPCDLFGIKGKEKVRKTERGLLRKMHKAIVVIKFKLEGQLSEKRPEFGMCDRNFLHCIDPEKGTVKIEGKEYPMKDCNFPTIDWEHPYELTSEEADVMKRLQASFLNCEKLQKHAKLLLEKGSLYRLYNGNLLYHGCVPMNEDGTFRKVSIYGEECSGKKLYDVLESYVRAAFIGQDEEVKDAGADILWYLWTAPDSPLFGRSKMATFENYFLDDEKLHEEVKNPYYRLLNEPATAHAIMKEFGLKETDWSHIINGHMPVHRIEGEKPVKCGGKVIVIDGGFSQAYRHTTGIAGYTLIANSYGLILTAHDPFVSEKTAISQEIDMVSKLEMVARTGQRLVVGDTDNGKRIMAKIQDLKQLIKAYRNHELREKK